MKRVRKRGLCLLTPFLENFEMARIDRAEIERIKRETDIVKLIESYGTQLKDRNKEGEWLGKCPVHDDHDASLCVNAETNLWCCHGACGKGGDVYQWVMLAENCSFDCAHDILKEGVYGGKVASKYSKSRKLACPLPFDAEEQALLGKVVQYYQDRLQDSEDAKNYLAARGIGDPQAIAHFRIGFVDRSLGRRIPPKPIKAGREMRAKLETLGIMKATTGHEQFRGCIVFPIFNLAGDIVQMYGRRIDRTAKASERHWYMSRPRAGIFNAEALQIYDEIILVESVIDAITFWVAGYQNVTTAWGNNGFTDEMLEAYKAANVKRVLIGYDNDDASNNKIPALQAKLNAANIDTFRMKYGACKDANEYAVKLQMGLDKGRNGHASLGLSIRNAEWLGNGVASNGVSPTITTDTPDFLKRARESIACEATIEANREAVANEPQQAIVSEPVVSEPIVATNESAAKEENAMEPQVSSLTPQASQKLQPTESRVPDAPKPAMIEAEIKDNEVLIPIGNRTYRVRGLERNAAFDVLKVNVLVRNGEAFFVDTLDLYAARSRNLFIKEASKELSMEEEAIKRDLGKIMLKLEELQDNRVELDSAKTVKPEMTEVEKYQALELLKSDRLIEKILEDFDACGVVGEQTNKLFGYIAATSRKLDKPLAVMVQSSSAAGKSSLMDAVLGLMPAEEQIIYSAMMANRSFTWARPI